MRSDNYDTNGDSRTTYFLFPSESLFSKFAPKVPTTKSVSRSARTKIKLTKLYKKSEIYSAEAKKSLCSRILLDGFVNLSVR